MSAPGIGNKCHCSGKREKWKLAPHFPVLTTILIAVLPKCPFCVLAYSSAITLCSGHKVLGDAVGWGSWLCLALAAFTLLMILLNYRGRRTWLAATLVLLGSALIIRTEWFTANLNDYYLGVFLLMMGIWLNGSFYYFFRKGKERLVAQTDTHTSPKAI
jgi:hypothetical protein